MGLMDRIKKVTGSNDTYDDNYDDDYYNVYDNNYEGESDDGDMQFAPQPQQNPNPGMNMNPGVMNPVMNPAPQQMSGGISLSGTNLKMQVVRPETYDSDTATQIANHLLNKCTVVLNLEKTSKEASRRLIDFLTGVAYSIGGDLKNIATNAYVITPSNVDVENAKIRTTPRQPEPEPEEPAPAGDFNDFN
ncbi:MAG: cell division protein SepF [Clostridia bacterium]|nr:cell division protein SepF [Clostridia bacterium]